MTSPEKKSHRTSVEMFPLMEAFEQGGQKVEQFCQEQGILKTTFQYWLRKYRQSKSPTESGDFITMQVQATHSAGECVEIIYSDGTRLRCPGNVTAHWVKEFLPAFALR